MRNVMTLRVKNWEDFQHYRDRRPPWIKLYRSLLDDPEFLKLCGDTEIGVLVRLWLIASEDKDMLGNLPASDALAIRLHLALPGKVKKRDIDKVNQILASLHHWLIDDCSNLLATRKQDAIPETETETEQSRDTRTRVSYSLEFETFRNRYPKHRIGGKLQEWKSWQIAKRSGMTAEKANEYLNRWLVCPKWKAENGKYIVAISRWLRDGYWQTEPSEYEPGNEGTGTLFDPDSTANLKRIR
jgi:hypothetical protein